DDFQLAPERLDAVCHTPQTRARHLVRLEPAAVVGYFDAKAAGLCRQAHLDTSGGGVLEDVGQSLAHQEIGCSFDLRWVTAVAPETVGVHVHRHGQTRCLCLDRL